MRGRGQGESIAAVREAVNLLGVRPVARGILSPRDYRRLYGLASLQSQLKWREDQHISEAYNAHYTNTLKELEKALLGKFNFLEGDIRMRDKGPVIGHDEFAFAMSVDEWLAICERSGRGIKLDIKDPAAINPLLAKTRFIEDHRLIFNVLAGDWDEAKSDATHDQIRRIRNQHPQTIINITPGSVPYTDKTLDTAIDAAKASDNPKKTMFPLQVEYITPHVVHKLNPHGMIGAWNIPLLYNPDDVGRDIDRLRKIGVDGMIDIRKYTNLPSIFPYRLSPALANVALRIAKEWERLRRN